MTDPRLTAQQYLPPIPEHDVVEWLLARLYELQIDFTLEYIPEGTVLATYKRRLDLHDKFIAYTPDMPMGQYTGWFSPSYALYWLATELGKSGLLPKQEQ